MDLELQCIQSILDSACELIWDWGTKAISVLLCGTLDCTRVFVHINGVFSFSALERVRALLQSPSARPALRNAIAFLSPPTLTPHPWSVKEGRAAMIIPSLEARR